MHKPANTRPRPKELPPIEFRKIIKAGFEELDNPGEPREALNSILRSFDELCSRLGEKCALRIVFEFDMPEGNGGFYELRVFKRSPQEYYITTNIDTNFDVSMVYALSYEIFLVSDDMINLEVDRASSAGLEVLQGTSIEEVFDKMLVLLGYIDQAKASPSRLPATRVETPRKPLPQSSEELHKMLNACLKFIEKHSPSTDPADMVLRAVVDGFGYYKVNDIVYCLASTRSSESQPLNGCGYILFIIRNRKMVDAKCYRDSASFLLSGLP